MPEPWNPTDAEIEYVKWIEKQLDVKLNPWQHVRMIHHYRNNKKVRIHKYGDDE